MKQAYISLHTGAPNYQLDQEVTYGGYVRQLVDFDEHTLALSAKANFPVAERETDEIITYIAVGACERGQGEIFMRIPILPHIPLKFDNATLTEKFWSDRNAPADKIPQFIALAKHAKERGISPIISIVNSAVILPADIHPIARVAHQLVYAGLITTSDLHPKLFEAVNNELERVGVEVLRVKREGAATMNGKMSQLPSLSGWENPAGTA